MVAPSHANWRDTGNLLARIFRELHFVSLKAAPLDCRLLIALSARALGATVYTRNRADFELIQRFRHFALVVLE